jgi:hypothetical protein
MPVVAEGLQGSHGVTTVGFVEVQPIEVSGHPGNLVDQVKLLAMCFLAAVVDRAAVPDGHISALGRSCDKRSPDVI